jgi:hypothetical protein
VVAVNEMRDSFENSQVSFFRLQSFISCVSITNFLPPDTKRQHISKEPAVRNKTKFALQERRTKQ